MSHCRVHLLDEQDIEIGVDLHANGRELLQSVCKYLNIIEIDYFGLKYKGSHYDGIWVRLDKPIKKQFSIHPKAWEFVFAVQYYPTDPVYLRENITKYQLCLQIRDDLMNGRLQCPLDTLVTLSSYWLQSEFGDEQQSSEVKRYLASLKYIPGAERPTPEFEEKVEKLYKSRKGMPAGHADTQFLRLASSLPLYGLHRYETVVKDGPSLTVAVGSAGLFEFKEKEKPTKFKWSNIKNINYKKETFYMKLLSPNKKEHSRKLVYHLKSSLQAKAMWKEIVDQHMFFRVTCSDSSSAGRTPIGTPQAKKNKPIAKRKRKISFRGLSFRRKRPKNEADVRKESSKISRPSPTVVRNSSLKRSSSTKSEPSVQSSSTESNSSSDKEKEKSSESPPLKSILKNHKFPNDVDMEGSEEDEGRSFTNEDFEDSPGPSQAQARSSLLLTETIEEENEDAESIERRSNASKKSPVVTPTTPTAAAKAEEFVSSAEEESLKVKAPFPINVEVCQDPSKTSGSLSSAFNNQSSAESPTAFHISAKDQTKRSIEVVVSSADQELPQTNKNVSHSAAKIESCEDSRKLSVGPSRSGFLPPPLLTQSTRDAIIPHYQVEKNATEDPSIPEMAGEMIQDKYVQENSKSKIANEGVPSELPTKEMAPFKNFKTSPDREFSQNGFGKSDDDEDERRTIGGASAVAVLGDDEEANMKDLVDDIVIDQYIKIPYEQDDNESRISESSESSISNLTDDTEELCNPNILEIIWSKCSSGKEYGYREIFGVKLRKVSGRLRHFRSTVFETEKHVSIGTQIPSPPSSSDDSAQKSALSSQLSFQSNRRKFVPSWPFDPDSLAVSTELDELDKEAIKAALKAQQELERDLSKITPSDPLPDHRISVSPKLYSDVTSNVTDDLYTRSSSTKRDSIPGIPSFLQSVLKSSNTSRSSSRRSSHKSTSISAAQLETSHKPIASSTDQLESLVFPPEIQTYQSKAQCERDVIKYKSETLSQNIEHTTTSTSKTSIDRQSTTGTFRETYAEATVCLNSTDKKYESKKVKHTAISAHMKSVHLSDTADSGRSTPSSVSSFPQFVHSVYPLRKMSTNWGSESTMSQQDAASDKVEPTVLKEDNFESSTSVSNCSIKSVRGSSSSSEDEGEVRFLETDLLIDETPTTEVTLIEFINETVDPPAGESSGNQQEPVEETSIQRTEQTLVLEDYSEEAFPDDSEESSETESKSDDSTILHAPLSSDCFNDQDVCFICSTPYKNEEEMFSNTSTESSGSSSVAEDICEDLSLDFSEILPDGEQRAARLVLYSSEHMSTIAETISSQRENESTQSSARVDEEASASTEQNIIDEAKSSEMKQKASYLQETPIIIISTERSESDKTNSDDTASISTTNSQDTCEYDVYQSLEGDKEQEKESSTRSQTPEGDVKDETEKA